MPRAFAFALPAAMRLVMPPDELRIALFSGNYNYVRDGANQALNRLMGFMLRQGAKVRVYARVSRIRRSSRPATSSHSRVPNPARR